MPSTSTSMLDGLSTSVAVKTPCAAVSTANLTLSALQTVNGVALAEGDRVLVRAQSTGSENGIYVASTGSWTRSKDFDGNRDVVQGTLVLVRNHIADGAIYEVTTENPITIGTTSLTFELLEDPNVSHPQGQIEIDASVTPLSTAYEVLNPSRYTSIANWAAVYAQVTTLAESFQAWYRVDHAQHPSLSNAIAGFQSYDDSQKTGTVGYRCTAFGALALKSNSSTVTAGGTNTAIGYSALRLNVEGSGNTACGPFSFDQITGVNSSHNNGYGYRTGASLIDGTQNNFFGFQTGDLLVTGNNNHAFGENTLSHLVYGHGNHAYGYQSSYTKIGGSFSHAFGYQSLFSENAAVVTGITKAASAVLTISTVSAINPFNVGAPVVIENVAGMTQINGLTGFVSAVGGASGAWTITVNINSSAFSVYTSGGYLAPLGNTVFGHRCGFNVFMRGGNTIIGHDAGQAAEPGYGNTLCGYQAGNTVNTNAGGDRGDLNSIYGFWAGLAVTSGMSNALFGQRAGISITTGSENVGIGPNSANGVTTAARGVFVGSTTGVNLNGANNTAVGYNAGSQGSAQTYTNTGSFGANAVPTASNQITLGDGSIATLRCQVTTITALSDVRFKEHIRPLDIPDEALDEIEIVVFDWIGGATDQVGVIAQQLDSWQERWGLQWLGLVDKSNPDRWEATPGKLLFLLIVKTQRLARRVAALEASR